MFTPMLKKFYDAAKASGEAFEVVFLSSDRSAAEQLSYMNEAHGDWCCLPQPFKPESIQLDVLSSLVFSCPRGAMAHQCWRVGDEPVRRAASMRCSVVS